MTPCSAAAGGSFSSRDSSRSAAFCGLLGQFRRLDLLAQFVDFGLLLVALAQLVLDRFHLLAQEELALSLVDLRLHLGLDLGAELDHVELAGEDLERWRRRATTSTSSSSSCFSSTEIRSVPAIRWARAAGSSRLATAIRSSSGR